MEKIKNLHHVAIIVKDMESALTFWRDTLGLELTEMEDNPGESAKIAFLPLSGSMLELIQPLSEESGLIRFIKKRGEGLHHICMEVDDIDQMSKHLLEKGVRLINDVPKTGADGRRYIFIHPQSSTGVLTELYEIPKSKDR